MYWFHKAFIFSIVFAMALVPMGQISASNTVDSTTLIARGHGSGGGGHWGGGGGHWGGGGRHMGGFRGSHFSGHRFRGHGFRNFNRFNRNRFFFNPFWGGGWGYPYYDDYGGYGGYGDYGDYGDYGYGGDNSYYYYNPYSYPDYYQTHGQNYLYENLQMNQSKTTVKPPPTPQLQDSEEESSY